MSNIPHTMSKTETLLSNAADFDDEVILLADPNAERLHRALCDMAAYEYRVFLANKNKPDFTAINTNGTLTIVEGKEPAALSRVNDHFDKFYLKRNQAAARSENDSRQ